MSNEPEPAMTGIYIRYHEPVKPMREKRLYEVCFAFEGETWYEDEETAAKAQREYAKLHLDALGVKKEVERIHHLARDEQALGDGWVCSVCGELLEDPAADPAELGHALDCPVAILLEMVRYET